MGGERKWDEMRKIETEIRGDGEGMKKLNWSRKESVETEEQVRKWRNIAEKPTKINLYIYLLSYINLLVKINVLLLLLCVQNTSRQTRDVTMQWL